MQKGGAGVCVTGRMGEGAGRIPRRSSRMRVDLTDAHLACAGEHLAIIALCAWVAAWGGNEKALTRIIVGDEFGVRWRVGRREAGGFDGNDAPVAIAFHRFNARHHRADIAAHLQAQRGVGELLCRGQRWGAERQDE